MFSDLRPGYLGLTADKSGIKDAIFEHPEFAGFMQRMEQHFDSWKMSKVSGLKSLVVGFSPKDLVAGLGDGLLAHYKNSPLINEYDVYQHLMDYWNETMQDDCYLISIDGWKAETRRIIEKDKKGKEKDKGWTCDLIAKELIVARYFSAQQQELDDLQAQLDNLTTQLEELEEEHGGDDGLYSELEKVTKGEVTARLREIKGDPDSEDEANALNAWLNLNKEQAGTKKAIKDADAALDQLALEKYPQLSEEEIKSLVVEDKWLSYLNDSVKSEMDRISQGLTQRIKELAERYETTLPQAVSQVNELESKVSQHLEKMGFSWN